MAQTMDNAVNRQLFFDLQKTFPEVPETVIVATLQQHKNNRDICYDVLTRERHKYVYGPFESAAGSMANQVRGLRLKDERGRGLSQPGIETRPPDPVLKTEYSYSQGMSHSRSEPHLLQETCHSPTHLGRPPEYSAGPVYYTDYTLAMRQHPAPPPPTIPYSQDARFQFPQQPRQPPPYSMMSPGYNSNGANYTYTTAGASSANNPGMKQEWTNPVSRASGDPHRSSSPYTNYPTQGPPYTPPRQDGNHWAETPTNSTHATPQRNLPPLYIDTNNPHPPRQFLTMANSLYGSHSPHNSRSQSPVVHNPGQMTLPQQPLPYQSGVPNHHSQGVRTPPGPEPGTPPVHFTHTNSVPNFHPMPPNRSQSHDSDQSLLETSDPHERLVHQQPIQPAIISRSSSQSSLVNNDFEGRTSRSNSTDDIAYTQALILHQKARKEKLEKEVERYRAFRDQLRTEVWAMENDIAKRKSTRNKDLRTTPVDLVQMREANRRLQVDIQLLYREVDSYEQGQQQPPVNENFYMNMDSTGQSGTLRPPPSGVIESLPSVPRLPIHSQEHMSNDEEQWACSACTFLNHPALDKCECCEFPRAVPHRQGHG